MNITIYTNPHCPYSIKAKKFFKRKKLPFEEKTLFKEVEHRLDVIDISGQLSTPLILIDGDIFSGFDEEKINTIVKKKKAEAKKK